MRILRKPHKFTEEENAFIRANFNFTHQSIRDIAERLSTSTGEDISEWQVRAHIQRLGLPRKFSDLGKKHWSPEEDERMRELLETFPTYEVARILRRSEPSVALRAKRIGVQRRRHHGWYNATEAAQILGVDQHRVQDWVERGILKASYHYGVEPAAGGSRSYHINEADLVAFIRRYSPQLSGRHVDLGSIVRMLKPNPVKKGGVKIRQIGHYNDGKEICWICLVDGKKVRDHLNINFTMGGHHYVYNRIPEDEIWIDDNNYKERAATIVHEVHERNKMKFKKLSYSKAHKLANRKEKEFRK